MAWPVMLYIPNLIGYVRIFCMVASFFYAQDNVKLALPLYLMNFAGDAVDGWAARKFHQSSKVLHPNSLPLAGLRVCLPVRLSDPDTCLPLPARLSVCRLACRLACRLPPSRSPNPNLDPRSCRQYGGVLDMVTDRVSTAGLCAFLAVLYPDEVFMCARTFTLTFTLNFTHTLTLSHSHPSTFSHSHTLTHSHTHTHTHTGPCTLIHTLTHTHARAHTHTHTPWAPCPVASCCSTPARKPFRDCLSSAVATVWVCVRVYVFV